MKIKKFLHFICSLLQLGIAIGIIVGYIASIFYATKLGVEYGIFYYILLSWSIMGWISLVKNITFFILSIATGEDLPTGWWDFAKRLVQAAEYDKMLPVQILIVLLTGGGVLSLLCYIGIREPFLVVKAISRGVGITLLLHSVIFSKFWRRLYLTVAIIIATVIGGVFIPALAGIIVIRWLQKIKKKYFLTINYK